MQRFTSLRARITALLTLSVLGVQFVSIYLLMDERYFLNQAQQVEDAMYRFVTIAALLEETPEYLHEDVLRAHSDSRHLFSLRREAELKDEDESGWALALEDIFLDYWDKTDFSISEPIVKIDTPINGDTRSGNQITIEAQLSHGDYLLGQFQPLETPLNLQYRLTALLVFSLILVLGLSALIMLALTRPLKNLTQAAKDFGRGKTMKPLRETGASDIRQAARAFNEMQRQLIDALNGQQHMLAAIGHDLRTPLTSLRVRVETLPDGPQRDKIIKKTEEMAAMLEAILAFAKAHADDYAIDLKKIDIAALLEDLCNDYKAAAKNVTSEIAGKIEINADMLNLRRALSNIIDNGLFYGTAVKLSLLTQQNNVIITIDDNGPGVDTGLLKDLVRPFFRSDTSRNNQSGGIGMGLALTKTVIERHRGTLDFRNTQSGFQVLVVLPLAAS